MNCLFQVTVLYSSLVAEAQTCITPVKASSFITESRTLSIHNSRRLSGSTIQSLSSVFVTSDDGMMTSIGRAVSNNSQYMHVQSLNHPLCIQCTLFYTNLDGDSGGIDNLLLIIILVIVASVLVSILIVLLVLLLLWRNRSCKSERDIACNNHRFIVNIIILL